MKKKGTTKYENTKKEVFLILVDRDIGKYAERLEYRLSPGEVVFIKTQEKLKLLEDILGRIAEKNSLMRLGLKVDGPHYQPGPIT